MIFYKLSSISLFINKQFQQQLSLIHILIDLPAPGSRHGITVEMIRELTEFTHRYKPGTLVMCFLDSNVEIADQDTIRQIAILMKQTGADIHAIGDGGFGGGTWPENIYQLAITMKGKAYTWAKMATPKR